MLFYRLKKFDSFLDFSFYRYCINISIEMVRTYHEIEMLGVKEHESA